MASGTSAFKANKLSAAEEIVEPLLQKLHKVKRRFHNKNDVFFAVCLLFVYISIQNQNMPERVPYPEDNESENEEVNEQLEGTFWCTCERCEIMPMQRECSLPKTARDRKQNAR